MATIKKLNPDTAAGNAKVKAPSAKVVSANLRKQGVKAAAAKYSTKVAPAKAIAGSSSYVAQENAARKQLGTAGINARAKQLPKATRAFARGMVREVTGIDISRKGVKVDPLALGMALPVGKVIRAAKALRAAGKIAEADALTTRVIAKAAGGSRAATRGMREQRVVPYMTPEWPGVPGKVTGAKARNISESVFPRLPKKGPMGQQDLGDLGAGRVGLPFNTPAQIRRSNKARQAVQAADRVYELEKRLNLPGTAPKRGPKAK